MICYNKNIDLLFIKGEKIMAFMGRGDMPSINSNIGGNENDNFDGGYRHHYGWYYRRMYYIPLDNTYVIMQMIVTFIILIIGVIAYLFTHKSSIIDPIENTKSMFMNTYLVVLLILLAVVAIANFFSKTKESLIKKLIIILVVSIVTMVAFLGIKLNYASTYNENKFEQLYSEQGIKESSNSSKLDIGIDGLSIKTEKEYYIDECMEMYNIFKIKTYVMLGLHLLLNALLIYQILKVTNIQEKKDRLSKDDLILFDEEQNVRF